MSLPEDEVLPDEQSELQKEAHGARIGEGGLSVIGCWSHLIRESSEAGLLLPLSSSSVTSSLRHLVALN